MIVTRYKPLFSFAASYDLAGIGITSDGLSIDAPAASLAAMTDLKLKPQFKGNAVNVFFEGKETPANAPVNCEPSIVIDTDKYFYLNINFSDKEKLQHLKFHSSAAIAKDIGFPVLYDALISVSGGATGVSIREDVKIVNPIFTFTVTQAQSGLTTPVAALEIKDEHNTPVNLNIPAAALNDKSIDGVSAVPEYAFSVDASVLEPGIYSFKVGSFQKMFFIATNMDISGAISLVRLLKNSFLQYKISLADKSFADFELLIPKA
jgi:hypothetical protein